MIPLDIYLQNRYFWWWVSFHTSTCIITLHSPLNGRYNSCPSRIWWWSIVPASKMKIIFLIHVFLTYTFKKFLTPVENHSEKILLLSGSSDWSNVGYLYSKAQSLRTRQSKIINIYVYSNLIQPKVRIELGCAFVCKYTYIHTNTHFGYCREIMLLVHIDPLLSLFRFLL